MYMASHTNCSALPLLLLLYLFLIVPPQVLVGARSLNGRGWQSGGATNDSLCELAVIPQGYKCQEYKVQTEDGYILGLQRIPQGRDSDRESKKRQPVLLQHGILVDGMSWALNSPEESLAFILADNGFDGTLIALSSLSQGKLVDKMKSAALLSPIAYLSHITTPLGNLAARAFVADVLVRDGVITKYNYGSKTANMKHYNQVNPPPYNMSNIPKDFPLFLSYGGRDELSDVEDVLQLLDDLKLHDVDKLRVQYVEEYAHADFILGINAKAIVYGSIISFFNTH
ncbi:hypothetical protein ZIOFF_026031 [Zingiber officinale]|uniref:Partial AB-hydrolase lipase domain-containing protein n=1 Tax=Zingiber officinale TaxID=94328 RepID=A0A8J5GV46_ZINOF|nr:hypothetical protein ZIOFF_026031 [Zingiber officinale]